MTSVLYNAELQTCCEEECVIKIFEELLKKHSKECLKSTKMVYALKQITPERDFFPLNSCLE